MTKPDDLTAMWILEELWGAPPDLSGSLTDEDNRDYGRALFCAANGDGRITDAERDWIVGYLRAAGHSDENIASLQAYEGTDDVDIYTREQELKARRIALVFPAGIMDEAAAARG